MFCHGRILDLFLTHSYHGPRSNHSHRFPSYLDRYKSFFYAFSRHYARILRLFWLNVQSLRFLSLVSAQLLIFRLISFVFAHFRSVSVWAEFLYILLQLRLPSLWWQWLFMTLTGISPLCTSISFHGGPWHIKWAYFCASVCEKEVSVVLHRHSLSFSHYGFFLFSISHDVVPR